MRELKHRINIRFDWNELWARYFNWAYFDMSVARIFCSIYKKDKKSKSEFEKLSSINIQHSSLTNHAKNRVHKDATYMFSSKKVVIED